MSPTVGLISAVSNEEPTDSKTLNIASLAVAHDINLMKRDTSGFNGLTSGGFDSFISAPSVRSQWIAFWILWIIWALLLLMNLTQKELVKRDDRTEIRQSTAERTERTETGTNTFLERLDNGLKRASRIAHDLLLGFLSALVMNTLGRGSGIAVEILSWIYLGLSIVWLGTEMVTENKLVRLSLGSVLLSILLTIIIISYATGWRFVG
ncbi:12818_t:CDS:2 [Dentiscutata heterogama]|uniref:12818_t:CDS:1 n=1 Tax=Dentiscutata heterogama TaxID=1316150 RepID=A0ACA9JWV9_9GLOM|nr:12818_t:CDS:2 [Dentiscutata heterogama]